MELAAGVQAAFDDLVEVYWADEWWPAVVLKQHGRETYIHLEGMGNSWNQWVKTSTLRKRSGRRSAESGERARETRSLRLTN